MSKPILFAFFLSFQVCALLPAQNCIPSDRAMCLNQERFRVEVDWRDFDGDSGVATVVPFGSDDSGLFWFFNSDNWEMLVKVLDGCDFNDHFWVFSAATTNVEYTLRVTDTERGVSRNYFNPLGTAADAITDTQAFSTCSNVLQREDDSVSSTQAINHGSAAKNGLPLASLSNNSRSRSDKQGVCTASNNALCLNEERFRVEVDWQNFEGDTGVGTVVPFGSDDSGLFWFFNSDNWEMLVKVLDGCDFNDHFWVFSAATTNVEYTLRVTDTLTGVSRSYVNPLGTAAPATTDTFAFATCSGDTGLPPDPGPAGDATLQGIDSDGDGIRDDVQRYIALNYPDSLTRLTLTQIARASQAALLEADSQELSLENAEKLMRGSECLGAVLPTDEKYRIKTLLLSEVLSTEERGLRYLDFNAQLSGQTFLSKPFENWATSCDFPLPASLSKVDEGDNCRLRGGDTRVYFVNGVLTGYDEAVSNCQVLAERLNDNLPPEERENLTVDLAYNDDSRVILIGDLWEAYRQDVNTDYSQFWRMLAGIELFPDFFQQTFLEIAMTVEIWGAVGNEDLQNHLSLYKDSISEGNKVIAVAHSQGNFFVNQAQPLLTSDEQESFGIVSVANPDSFVAGHSGPAASSPYTTITEDRVIDSLATDLFLDPLPANVINGEAFLGDWLRHGFTDTYMLPGSPSLTNFLADFRSVRDSLEQPDQTVGEGIITVTLTWGEEPDVDLHAFEPNGEHVYYANRQGVSGFLDVDDVSSFGPEHYFVSCDTLETGTYRIGVNYFRGYGPEVAQVLIQAGLTSRQFAIPLNVAVGSSGDNSPIPVANIVVSGNNEDGFDFRILE